MEGDELQRHVPTPERRAPDDRGELGSQQLGKLRRRTNQRARLAHGYCGYRRPPMSCGLRLHDVPGRQVLRPGPAGAREHLALVPARSEDRRARPERRRQVDAPADHGRARTSRRPASPSSRPARPSACSSRSRSSIRPRTCAATSRTASARLRDLLDRFNEISAAFAEPDADFDTLLAEQAKVQDADRPRRRSGSSTTSSTTRWTRSGCPTATATSRRSRAASAAASRSAGCSSPSPDLLLLDEPTNHLDAESVLWLERFLADYKGTVVAVTHDRYFLDNVAGWILELDRGRGIPFQGNYSSWLEQKQARLAHEEKTESARRRTLARELEWVRTSPRARHAKAKARLGAYEKLLAEEQNVKLDRVEIHIPPGPRLGDVVIEADGVRKGFGDRLLFEDLTFSLPPAGIVGVVGPNGAGKTTLFRMIAGEEQPDDGTLRVGDTVAARLRRPGARRPRPGEHRLEGDLGRPRHDRARQARGQLAPVRRAGSTSAAATSRSASPTSRAASGTASTSRSSCARAATSCSSTSRRTTSTSTRCARSRRRCSSSPAAPS